MFSSFHEVAAEKVFTLCNVVDLYAEQVDNSAWLKNRSVDPIPRSI